MLSERNFTDGRFKFALVPTAEGYLVKVDDSFQKDYNMKQYYTKDEDSAMAAFEALIGCYQREGEEALFNFSIVDRLGRTAIDYITVNVE